IKAVEPCQLGTAEVILNALALCPVTPIVDIAREHCLIVEEQIAAAQNDTQTLIHFSPIYFDVAAFKQLESLMLGSAGTLGAAVRTIFLITISPRSNLSAIDANQIAHILRHH
ncbi:MAG TPA: hypothetical protein VER26_17245, partial [Xanthobacteraceae bacterium]|nr:hypothetical protein [Xanthobacteraceae bacterium]